MDANGIGRSKGFAFVEFSTHETALTALRATNNNPSLFANRKVYMSVPETENGRMLCLFIVVMTIQLL